jgi:hypothetical protein
MAMTFIQSGTVATNGGNVVFSSIPQNFSHLQVRVFGRGMATFSPGLTLYLNFNGDGVSANYQNHGIFGDGSTISSTNNLNGGSITIQQCLADAGTAANIFGSAICDILDYRNTAKNKTVRTLAGLDRNGSGRAMLYSGLWMQTAAINSITVATDSGFLAGSRADLYGISISGITGA